LRGAPGAVTSKQPVKAQPGEGLPPSADPVQIYPQPRGNGGVRQAVGSQQNDARAQRQRLRRRVSPHQSLEFTALDLRQFQRHRLAMVIPTSS